MRRKISLMVLLAFVATMVTVNHGCSTSGTIDVEEEDDTISFDINEPKFKERLGVDDGYAFAVLYGADIHGSLETCG